MPGVWRGWWAHHPAQRQICWRVHAGGRVPADPHPGPPSASLPPRWLPPPPREKEKVFPTVCESTPSIVAVKILLHLSGNQNQGKLASGLATHEPRSMLSKHPLGQHQYFRHKAGRQHDQWLVQPRSEAMQQKPGFGGADAPRVGRKKSPNLAEIGLPLSRVTHSTRQSRRGEEEEGWAPQTHEADVCGPRGSTARQPPVPAWLTQPLRWARPLPIRALGWPGHDQLLLHR